VTWLLDVSVIVARLVQNHEHHGRVDAWWSGGDLHLTEEVIACRVGRRAVAVCPITELGFLRVACALGSTMGDARAVLTEFLNVEAPTFIACGPASFG
jgi:predicted nucleic acid-binding protein